MLRKILFALTLLASISLAGGSAIAADPTLQEVYQAAQAGRYQEAQTMMDQVLRDHPNSAKAHFVMAELLAKEGRVSNARSELATAEHLAPGLPFARPEAVQELRARLTSVLDLGQPAAALVPASQGTGFPWGTLLLMSALVATVVFAVRMIRQRSTYAAQRAGLPGYAGGATPAQPYAPGSAGAMTPTGGMGSGILGGLATGAAVGAGVVAGEALMHRLLEGHHADTTLVPTEDRSFSSDNVQSQYDMGGEDFGVTDTASWDDSSAGGQNDWS